MHLRLHLLATKTIKTDTDIPPMKVLRAYPDLRTTKISRMEEAKPMESVPYAIFLSKSRTTCSNLNHDHESNKTSQRRGIIPPLPKLPKFPSIPSAPSSLASRFSPSARYTSFVNKHFRRGFDEPNHTHTHTRSNFSSHPHVWSQR